MVGGLLGTLFIAGHSAAQSDTAREKRLMVNPREMATGTRTGKAGVFPMPGGSVLYVPPKCVGTRRCPLWVTYPDAGRDSVVEYLRRGVDEFGILLLMTVWEAGKPNVVDTAMKQVLAQFAVDPEKIAISDTRLVFANPGIFSRAIRMFFVADIPHTIEHLGDPRVEIFEEAGMATDSHHALTSMAELADLRAQGYHTKQWFGLRAHGFDDYNGYGPQATFYFLARWLDESWRIPDPAQRPKPAVVADTLPLLTPKALTQMITFWESFRHEPDSILGVDGARHRYLREVLVPVGPQDGWPSTGMVDMAALAAAVPSVTAKLKAAGLTGQQHDAYRIALLSAIFVAAVQDPSIPARRRPALTIDEHSVMGQNMAFVLAHPDELLALEQTGIWMTP